MSSKQKIFLSILLFLIAVLIIIFINKVIDRQQQKIQQVTNQSTSANKNAGTANEKGDNTAGTATSSKEEINGEKPLIPVDEKQKIYKIRNSGQLIQLVPNDGKDLGKGFTIVILGGGAVPTSTASNTTLVK